MGPETEDLHLIPLTQGQFARVDGNVWDDLMRFKWYAHKDQRTGKLYAARKAPRCGSTQRMIRMHRQILGLDRERCVVDHADDKATLDNRLSNIRTATYSQNRANSAPRKWNKVGMSGVSWFQNRIWRVRIGFQGKRKHVGLFENLEDAIAARNKAAAETHGAFAYRGTR